MGKTPLNFRTWHHVVLVRDERRAAVFRDGRRSTPGGSCGITPRQGVTRNFGPFGGEGGRLQKNCNIQAVQELLGHKDVSTAMIYTHVLNRGGRGVRSLLDSGGGGGQTQWSAYSLGALAGIGRSG
jgi:integrase